MNVVASARPRTITVAVVMLSIVVLYGLAAKVVLLADGHVAQSVSQGLANSTFVIYTVLIGALINSALRALFIYKIFNRRNWARIIYLLFFILGVLLAIRSYVRLFFHPAELNYPVVMGYLGLACILIELVALALLFSGPGNLWFKRSLI